jgi:signal transduction histidine kinase
MKAPFHHFSFFTLLLLFFFCPCAVIAQGHDLNFQDIMKQWAAIERRLLETREEEPNDKLHHAEAGFTEAGFLKAGLLNDVDIFRKSIQSYLNSEKYRIYRFAPLSSRNEGRRTDSSKTPFIFRPSAPNEIPEIQAAVDMSFAFSEAVSSGDWESAVFISTDISGSLIQALIRNDEAEKYAGGAFFRLLLAFIVFIALTAFVILFMYKALVRSFRREAEGSIFTQAILFTQEEERARISLELHDTVAQDLLRISLNTETMNINEDAAERNRLCAEVVSSQKELMRRLRGICEDLIPPDFQRRHLPEALRNLCHKFKQRTGVECQLTIQNSEQLMCLNSDTQLQCFRIIQECLANIEKHADLSGTAGIVMVFVNGRADGKLVIIVSDNGKGFLPPNKDSRQKLIAEGHFGLWGIYERAAALNGTLAIDSEDGEGTTITLKVPFQGEPCSE